jgi:hypothetical protein
VTADGQKRRLKKKAQPNRKKIESSRPKNARAQCDSGAHDCRKETDCRKRENAGIWERLRQRPQPGNTSEPFSSLSGIKCRVLLGFEGARLSGASFSSRSILSA